VSWRRNCWCGLLASVVVMASACYVYIPAAETPAPGTRLSFDLNDRGRVGLGGRIGPSATKVEGTLKNVDSAFEMSVLSVEYQNGQRNNWTGEALTVSRDYVGSVEQRQFSQTRTWLTAGGIAAASVAFIVSRGLFTTGNEGKDPGNGEPPPQSSISFFSIFH
jgi:hypothetical protein